MIPEWLFPAIFTATLAIIGWFFRRLIREMESKVTTAQNDLKEAQENIDEIIKERVKDIARVAVNLQENVKELNTQVRVMEKNVVELSFTTKRVDERSIEKFDTLNKNSEQINMVLQRILLAEEKIKDFGKVIVKN